jgi:hypothetical protein
MKTKIGAALLGVVVPVLTLAGVAGATPVIADPSDTVTSIAADGGVEVGAVLVAAATASVAVGVLSFGIKKGWAAMFGRGARGR